MKRYFRLGVLAIALCVSVWPASAAQTVDLDPRATRPVHAPARPGEAVTVP
jgi:hypothetical protein